MSGRKQTPMGVLDLLMNGTEKQDKQEIKQETLPTVEQANNKTIEPVIIKAIEHVNNNNTKQQNRKSIKTEGSKTSKQESNRAITEDAKEKATFNLSLSTLENLEDAWLKLKRKLKGEQRITKTLIVELAIEMAVYELKAKDTQSNLYKKLVDG